MIYIINCNLGNLRSVVNMVDRIGGEVKEASTPGAIADAQKIILPGVGSFDHGMQGLREGGWIDALNEAVLERRISILGICLGMQLMCKSSGEGQLPGFGWIDAQVERFNLPVDSGLKVPHMGWNKITVAKPNPLVSPEEREQRFYFVHSYHAVCHNSADVLATAHHGYDFTAAFGHENIFGVQFHPEKSHRFGMALMRKFVKL